MAVGFVLLKVKRVVSLLPRKLLLFANFVFIVALLYTILYTIGVLDYDRREDTIIISYPHDGGVEEMTSPVDSEQPADTWQAQLRHFLRKCSRNRKQCSCGAWNVPNQPALRVCDPDYTKNLPGSAFHPRESVLLTLFTTFQYSPKRETFYNNTLRLWSALGRTVRPLLFLSDVQGNHELVVQACNLGWAVYVAPSCHVYLPVLPDMFLAAHHISPPTDFIGFANADILFDENLVSTLLAMKKFVKPHAPEPSQVLGFGERIEVTMSSTTNLTSLEQARHLALRVGEIGYSYAIDYFISTPGGFPWASIPRMVVGRVGFDNWLIAYARERSVPTVDLSETVLAMHQWGDDEIHWISRAREFGDFNLNLLGGFNADKGLTTCARYKTMTRGQPAPWLSLRLMEKLGIWGEVMKFLATQGILKESWIGRGKEVKLDTVHEIEARLTAPSHGDESQIVLAERQTMGFCDHYKQWQRRMNISASQEVLVDVQTMK